MGTLAVGLLSQGLASAQGVNLGLTQGDVAILHFLAAAEILESDLWQQYNELGGLQVSDVPRGSGNSAYTKTLSTLDADMAQYIHAYLASQGTEPVNLDPSGPYRAVKRLELSKWDT